MAIASKTEEGKIFVECIDCREVRAGDTWMLAYLKGWKARKVVIDGASGQQLLEEEMREYGIKNAHLPTVKEIIAANAKFEQGLYQRSIVHSGQPSLVQAVSNCEKRAIGSNGGFGYKAIKEEIEIALLDSVILAYWAYFQWTMKLMLLLRMERKLKEEFLLNQLQLYQLNLSMVQEYLMSL